MKLELEGVIGIESLAFKAAMNKLERIEQFVTEAKPIIEEYNRLIKDNPTEKKLLTTEEAMKILNVSCII